MEVQLPKGDYLMELWDPIVREGRRFFKLKVNRGDNTVATGRDITENTLMLELDQMVHQMPSKGVLLDGMDQNLERQIDSFVKSYLDTYNIPGVSLALIDKGKVAYYQTYGVQNAYTREPVNNRTRFEAASITKPFFAFAVLRLSERGFIELDRPLYQYLKLPEDIQDDPRAKKLTARIVLSHSTGLPNWPWLTDNGRLAIQHEPGSTYTYSGAGYGYLQEVIESITGKDIVTVLQEEVIDVLEIENTYFEYQPFLLRNTSVGHNDGGIPHANDIRPTAHVASSMITDAESLSRFFIQILDRKGLQKATYDDFFKLHTMTNPETAREEGNHYFGLGLYFEETPFGLSFGHSGNNGDFKCDAVIFEDLGKGFVLLTNNGYGDALLYDLYDFLFYGNKKS
jgi:CubicO group peptidase (beta-lactamase class C family)